MFQGSHIRNALTHWHGEFCAMNSFAAISLSAEFVFVLAQKTIFGRAKKKESFVTCLSISLLAHTQVLKSYWGEGTEFPTLRTLGLHPRKELKGWQSEFVCVRAIEWRLQQVLLQLEEKPRHEARSGGGGGEVDDLISFGHTFTNFQVQRGGEIMNSD